MERIVASDDSGISRAELAYRSIRDAILSNLLRVGEHLREESIAEQLGVSRTPVREALGRLRAEGLINEAKPRGYVVSSVTPAEVFDVYAVRGELEGFCLRLAAGRITPHQLFQLATTLDQMELAVADPGHFSKLNRQFHQIILDATGNPVLTKIVDDLMAVVERFPVSAYEVAGRTQEVVQEHRRILDTLTRHDPVEAEAAIRDHLQVGLEARLIALRHQGQRAAASVSDRSASSPPAS